MVNHKRPNEDSAEMPTEETQDGKRRKKESASNFITPYPLEALSTLVKNCLGNDTSLERYEKLAQKLWEIYHRFRNPESDLYKWMDDEIAAQTAKGLSVTELRKARGYVWAKHYKWAKYIDAQLKRCAEQCRSQNEDQHRAKRLNDQFEELGTRFGENFRLVKILYELDKYKAAIVELLEAGEEKSDKFDKAWTSYQKDAARFRSRNMLKSLQGEKTNGEEKKRIKEHLEYYSKMCNEMGTRSRRKDPDFTYKLIIPFPLPSKSASTFKDSKLKAENNPTLKDYESFATDIMGSYEIYRNRKNKGSALNEWKAKDLAAQIKNHPQVPHAQLCQPIDAKMTHWRRYMDAALLLCKEEVEEMGAKDPTLSVQPVMVRFEELRHLFFELSPFNLGRTLDTLDKYFKKVKQAENTKDEAKVKIRFKYAFEPCEYKLDEFLKAQALVPNRDTERILSFKQLYSAIKSRQREKRDARKGEVEVEKNTNLHEEEQEVEEDEESEQEESNEEYGSDESEKFDESAYFNEAMGI